MHVMMREDRRFDSVSRWAWSGDGDRVPALRRVWALIGLVALLIAVIGAAGPGHAETADLPAAREVCRAWLEHQVTAQGAWAGSRTPVIAGEEAISKDGEVLGWAFRIAPQGFVVVPAERALSPVQVFSEHGSLDFATANLPAEILQGRLALASGIVTGKTGAASARDRDLLASAGAANRSRWDGMTTDAAAWMRENSRPAEGAGPLLSTRWAQGPPFNRFCPIGRDSVRCVAGCAPIAAAQIARYHAYPPNGGIGEAYLRWAGDDCRDPHSAGAMLYADFRDGYDWDRMPDACGFSCGGAADSAVAELCYELGVDGHVDYGTSCGTSGTLEETVATLQNHLGYERAVTGVTRSEVADGQGWFRMLRDEIDALRPILYRFTYESGAGNHALVCDGWRIDTGVEYVSLNLGGGGVTAWFAADDNGISIPSQDYAVLRLGPPQRAVTVRPEGGGDYPDIQSAIDAEVDGTVIELLDGIYRGAGNRDLDCRGKRVIIRSRSGDPALCAIDCQGDSSEPHRAFVFQNGETRATRIEGITMRNGLVAGGTGTDPARGGAALCENSSPRFRNCVFSLNRAGEGGAIGCSGSAAPAIESCVFWKNAARDGGAFFKTGPGDVEAIAITAWGNDAVTGSGFFLGSASALRLQQSIVGGSRTGAAVHVEEGGDARLLCCDLYGNEEGDWTDAIADQLQEDGNISADPGFCDAEAGDLSLNVVSPCAEPACGRMGARPAGCGRHTYLVGAAAQYPYRTIAQALAAARPGGWIILMDSLYTGEGNRDLVIPVRGLTIESNLGDPATCVLDLQGSPLTPHRAFSAYRRDGVTFRGITMRHGWSDWGGALQLESPDSTRILDCVFHACAAGGLNEVNGGAVCLFGTGSHGGPTTIRGCSFDSCTAVSDGGAIQLSYLSPADTTTIEDCTFRSNTAAGRGGALAGRMARVKVKNTVFLDNAAPTGGTVTIDAESRFRFTSCTMVGSADPGRGGCVYIDNSDLRTFDSFTRCVLVSPPGRSPIECAARSGAAITVTCSALQPAVADTSSGCLGGGQSGNIVADPQFCDAPAGDYRLHTTSPCAPDQAGNQGCGLVGAYSTGCGPLTIPDDPNDPDDPDNPDDPDDEEAGPLALSIRRCVPNPFHEETRIGFAIPGGGPASPIDISIFDAAGRLTRTLLRGDLGSGEHVTRWNALDDAGVRVSSGVFFCRLRAGGAEATRRLIVIR